MKKARHLHELQISEHCLFAFILQSEFVAAAFDKQLLDRHQLFHIHRLQDRLIDQVFRGVAQSESRLFDQIEAVLWLNMETHTHSDHLIQRQVTL